MKRTSHPGAGALAGVLIGSLVTITALAGDGERKIIVTTTADADDLPAPPVAPEPPRPPHVIIRTLAMDDDHHVAKEAAWLGVGVEESSEALIAQLGLKPGEGLVVNYVATNSPAAAAGLQRNDVLVELDGQMLVDALQLRKLIQMHAAGDGVKITFYRGGRKDSATAKLVNKKTIGEASWGGGFSPGDMRTLELRLQSSPDGTGTAKGNLNIEVRSAMEEARRAMQDAMSQMPQGPDADRKLEIIKKRLGGLADGGVNLNQDSTVIVKNDGEAIRTMVKKDKTGSYVILADPQKHLTVHDPAGKLIFDGPVETPEQQEKVPRDIWAKAAPMLEQLSKNDAGSAPRAVVNEAPEK